MYGKHTGMKRQKRLLVRKRSNLKPLIRYLTRHVYLIPLIGVLFLYLQLKKFYLINMCSNFKDEIYHKLHVEQTGIWVYLPMNQEITEAHRSIFDGSRESRWIFLVSTVWALIILFNICGRGRRWRKASVCQAAQSLRHIADRGHFLTLTKPNIREVNRYPLVAWVAGMGEAGWTCMHAQNEFR